MTAWFRGLLLILLANLSGAYPAATFASAISVAVEERASSRAEAEREALVTAVQEALTQFMQAQAKDPSVEERIRKELGKIRHRHYKPLVKR